MQTFRSARHGRPKGLRYNRHGRPQGLHYNRILVLAAAVLIAGAATLAAQSPKYSVGRTPTDEDIRALGIVVAPDGTGLLLGRLGEAYATRFSRVSGCVSAR